MRDRVRRRSTRPRRARPARRPHERTTLELARAVVARDVERGWELLAQPQRLRVDTLDAFNAWLAQQLPVLADGVAAARIVDDARDDYRLAARRTVAAVSQPGEPGDSLRVLAREFDDLTQLEKLLARLLARREQWLERFAVADADALRPLLENALRHLVDDQLGALGPLVEPSVFGELRGALRHVASHASAEKLREATEPWLRIEAPMPLEHGSLQAWQGAAAFLLIEKGEWRRQLSKREGFGKEHGAVRERCERLIARLRGDDALREALREVRELPEPRYTDAQWRQLEALRTVLLHLAAELKVHFAERRNIDFVELGLAARRALGRVEAPSELLLALDRRIQHVLVDEFQDTSQSQVGLLELLTAGWERGDGRTLFLVGDPMQSIYRFRDADLSLFLEAKQRGVGDIRLEPLVLERNFRSAPAIVAWVNETFARVFPSVDQIAAGAASFRASIATRAATAVELVEVHGEIAADARAESARVTEIVAAERERAPEESIAVLVQSRNHLVGLRERLRGRGLPVHAVEIDALGEQPLAQDLLGLARALAHFDDRIAWLAVLRAPWCGLTWVDLHALCHDASRGAIWDLICDSARVARLGADGRARLEALRSRLEHALAARSQTSFATWVERTWQRLDGPACLDHDDDLRTAEQFFAVLAREERRGDLDDPARLEDALAAQQPQGDPPRGSGIEIMTMHRAKGLEFDTVIALGLGRDPPSDDEQALHWLERVAIDGSKDLLLAPALADREVEATHRVRTRRRPRARARRTRALVLRGRNAGARAAASRLAIAAVAAAAESRLAVELALGHAAPARGGRGRPNGPTEPEALEPVLRRLSTVTAVPAVASTRCDIADGSTGAAERATAARTAVRRRLATRADGAGVADPERARPEFLWASRTAAHVGTVVHRHLQRIAESGLDFESAASIEQRAPAYAQELRLLGVEEADVAPGTARVIAALHSAIEDPHGRFVLGAHDDARSELTLTLRSGDVLEHIRLDRTFVADGERWIVDFKTSRHEGGDRTAFLDSEVERYRPQLDRYAAALAAIERCKVRVALYFPLLKELRTWPAG